jgi:hypothetical protein
MKLTPAMVHRYEASGTSQSAPCIICGGKWPSCGHRDETIDVCARLKKLGKAGRAAIAAKNGEDS